jgi:hypothetical protein
MRHSTARFSRLRPAGNRPIARMWLDNSTHMDCRRPASRTVARPRSGQPTGHHYWRTRRSACAVPNSFKGADLAFALARRHHTGRQPRPAPTCARWPGTPTPTLPPAATAACSPARPAKTALSRPTPPVASPTWPPTRTRHRHGAGLQQRRSLPLVPGPPAVAGPSDDSDRANLDPHN